MSDMSKNRVTYDFPDFLVPVLAVAYDFRMDYVRRVDVMQIDSNASSEALKIGIPPFRKQNKVPFPTATPILHQAEESLAQKMIQSNPEGFSTLRLVLRRRTFLIQSSQQYLRSIST